jgi:hypothetical protein
MMDWTKQAEQMVHTWTDVQRQMLDTWLTPMKGLASGQSEAAASEYLKGLEAWEGAVQKSLDAQANWLRLLTESMTANKNPADVATAWSDQTREMTQIWSDANEQLWQHLQASTKEFDPSKAVTAESWQKQSEAMMQAWKDASEAVRKTIADWNKQWGAQG